MAESNNSWIYGCTTGRDVVLSLRWCSACFCVRNKPALMQNGDLNETSYHSILDNHAMVFAFVFVPTQVTRNRYFKVFRMVAEVLLRRMSTITESPAQDKQSTRADYILHEPFTYHFILYKYYRRIPCGF